MTSFDPQRVVQFARSIHMRRSTAGLVVFFLVTVAAYLLVRPDPAHVAQARRVAQAVAERQAAEQVAASPTSRHATYAPAPTATPTPTVTATADPSATATPTAAPTASVTPSPTADTGLLGTGGTSQSAVATAPAPTSGVGISAVPTQP
ncbi:hypothetical protein [Frankia sp. AgB32]|uniref:hypothetical protein n=1 Tax=Frankia sp. AgB32 TaxID=631119 RepID=UPI00200DAC76|nr:hypothetical protein [Frankia sp. AgB32]MCK9896215.1 hypothetical protein [Frankia sp. AgB32]